MRASSFLALGLSLVLALGCGEDQPLQPAATSGLDGNVNPTLARPPSWQPAFPIHRHANPSVGGCSNLLMETNIVGTSVIAWSDDGLSPLKNLHVAFGNTAGAISPATPLAQGNSLYLTDAAIDSTTGHSAVAWIDGAAFPFTAISVDAGVTWTVTAIPQALAAVGVVQVSFITPGVAVYHWWESPAFGSYSLLTASWNAATGWSVPVPIHATTTSFPYNLIVAADVLGGSATVAWTETPFTPGLMQVRAVQQTAPGTWTAPRTLGLAQPGNGSHLPLTAAVSIQGNATALWADYPLTGGSRLHAADYSAAGGWGVPVLLDQSTYWLGTGFQSPDVAFDAAGNAIAIWSLDNRPIRSGRYQPGTGWGLPQQVVPPPVSPNGFLFDLDLAVDLAGNAAIGCTYFEFNWTQSWQVAGTTRYTPATGWQPLRAFAGLNSRGPRIGFNPVGHALAAWSQTSHPFGSWAGIEGSLFR